MNTQPSVLELKQIIAREERLIEKHSNELSATKATLRAICPHENTCVVEQYVDGDYYNRAYSERTTVCEDCNTIIDHQTNQHSHYG